ncbi:GNAT family N-acetyltransferase [Luteimonas sp. S4-F44]|uniref:GNAT family N-acetyltransferase n=1 Tax=Luteimonas sp. S4-F44 TaxID=2925842 RepID=UPI001F531552|nr:GNAT family N-acetyltransferase [Luteimonas sp. S4-F44]UNK43708.1 GNAT family N-acetyltransferase [Luteimonas sp. S4-F44]
MVLPVDPAPCARDATTADRAHVLAMMRAFYAEDRLVFDPVRVGAGLDALLADPVHGAVLLLGDGGDDGYLVLTRGFSLEQGGAFALLDELYVAPQARGRGLGAQALALAAERGRAWGVAMLRLEVHHHNPRAKALYLRAGFVDGHRDMLTLPLDAPAMR